MHCNLILRRGIDAKDIEVQLQANLDVFGVRGGIGVTRSQAEGFGRLTVFFM